MAVSVTANLTDITLGESTDDSYWTGEDGYSTEVYRQGSSAQAWIVAKNGNETASFDCYSKSGLRDMSATGTHLYLTMRCDVAPFIDYVHVGLQSDTAHGSSTSGTYYWTIVDNTTNIEWYGEWKTFVLDVNSSSTFSTSGTLSLAGITDVHINVDNSNSGNIRSIENTYIDCVRFGTGLTLTGTDWDFADVAAIDNGSSYKWDIIKKVGPGVFELKGQLNIGNGATTTTPDSSNETLFYRDVSTQGEAGGPLGKVASGFYKVTFQGSGLSGDFNNLSVIASSNYPFILDADDTNLGTDAVVWNGGLVVQASTVSLKSGLTFSGITFEGCGQIDPSTATFQGNTISNYTGSDGAVLFPSDDTNFSTCTFTNCSNGIEYDSSSDSSTPTSNGHIFDDVSGKYDFNNTSGGAVSIAKTNSSNPNSYNPGGSSVTFSASYTFEVTGLESGTEVTIVTAGTTTVLHHTESASTSDGDGKYKISYSHSGGASVDVLVHHVDYKPDISNIYGLTLPNSNSTAKVSMFDDENYENPT